MRLRAFAILGLAILIALTAFSGQAEAANFTVDSGNDTVDINPGDGVCEDGEGNCTLRAAIMETNALAGAEAMYAAEIEMVKSTTTEDFEEGVASFLEGRPPQFTVK